MTIDQRRGLVGETYDQSAINAELAHLHKRVNELLFPSRRKVFTDYQATVFDRRIACMRGGITVRLPLLKKEDDGAQFFISDRSGEAATSNITISVPPDVSIGASSTLTISANYGFKAIEWDFKENKYFEIV